MRLDQPGTVLTGAVSVTLKEPASSRCVRSTILTRIGVFLARIALGQRAAHDIIDPGINNATAFCPTTPKNTASQLDSRAVNLRISLSEFDLRALTLKLNKRHV
jgi:hypothetical protein